MEVIEVEYPWGHQKGLPSRDATLQAYIDTWNLQWSGVTVYCFNFMPVIDWARSDLAFTLEDGSQVLFLSAWWGGENESRLNGEGNEGKARGYSLPGWESDRISSWPRIWVLSDNEHRTVLGEHEIFLDAVIPYAEKYDIKMPFILMTRVALYGLPKVITDREHIRTFLFSQRQWI